MLVGLCYECNADILLRLSTTNEVLQTVTVRGSSVAAVHGLPMWQSIKIKLNDLNYSSTSLKVEFIPKLNVTNIKPMWAIANVRQCPSEGVYSHFLVACYCCNS